MKPCRLVAPLLPLALVLTLCSCRQTPQQKYSAFLEKGKQQLSRGDYPRAVLEFRNAIRLNPKSSDAYYELALAYLGANDVQNAVKSLFKTVELNPKNTAAELKLSELAIGTHDPVELREAEKHVRRVLEDSPQNVDALDILARTEWQLGNQDEAKRLLDQAFAESPQNLKSAVDLAQLKLAKNDTAGAESILKKLIEANPKSVEAAVVLGRFYVLIARPGDAERQFEQALKLDPQNGAALISLASIRWTAGQMDSAEQLYRRAASLPDPRYQPFHAMFLFRTGKRDAAVSEFEKLYRQNPSDRASRTRLILAYQAVNRGGDAEKLIAAALKKNPQDVDALLEESALDLRKGNPNQAKRDLMIALHFQPDSPKAHFLLAAAHQMSGETETQKQELTRALQLDPNLLPARLQLAELLVSRKQANEARTLLSETPRSQTNDLSVLAHRNWAALALGDQATARSGVDLLLARTRSPEALLQDATLKLISHDYAGGRKSLQEALQKSPDDRQAVNLMVQSYAVQKQLPAGVEWLRDYISRHPQSASAQLSLGQILMTTGDPTGARAAFLAAKAADSELTALVDLNLARIDMQDGKLDEARKALSLVISRTPADISARLMLGNVEQLDRKYPAAIEQYRHAVETDGRNVEALNDLAYALAEYGKDPDQALLFAQKAGELAPDNANVADTLGWVFYRKALYRSAIPYLERAASLQPSGLRKCHLALAYMKSGDQQKGQQMLAAALQMDPGLSHSDLLADVAGNQGPTK